MNLIAADQQQHRNGDRADGIHQRRTDGLNAHAAQVGAEEAAGRLLEAQNLPQLGVEGLHDAVAGDRFMQNVLNLGQLVLAGAGAGAHFAADLARGGDDHGNKQQQRPAQLPAQLDDQAPARRRKVKNCCRKSPITELTAVCTRSTSLISVERMVPVACL